MDRSGAPLHRVFRAGARYRLALFDRLPAEHRELLEDLRADPGFYGVLLPRDGTSGTAKAVDRETALLWYTLRDAGPLPEYVRRDAGDSGARRQLCSAESS